MERSDLRGVIEAGRGSLKGEKSQLLGDVFERQAG